MLTTDLIHTLARSPLGRTRSGGPALTLPPLGKAGAILVGTRTFLVTSAVEVESGVWNSEPEKLG